jgi:hypothetical protein
MSLKMLVSDDEKITFALYQRPDGLWCIREEVLNKDNELQYFSTFNVLADTKEEIIPLLEMVLEKVKESEDVK